MGKTRMSVRRSEFTGHGLEVSLLGLRKAQPVLDVLFGNHASDFDCGVCLPFDKRNVMPLNILDNRISGHAVVGDNLVGGLRFWADDCAVEDVGVVRSEEERVHR